MPRKPKAEIIPPTPHYKMSLDTLAGVRGEMARLYRLAINGKIKSEEMTRLIYALKEIRCCIEAESRGEPRTMLPANPSQAAVRALHSVIG